MLIEFQGLIDLGLFCSSVFDIFVKLLLIVVIVVSRMSIVVIIMMKFCMRLVQIDVMMLFVMQQKMRIVQEKVMQVLMLIGFNVVVRMFCSMVVMVRICVVRQFMMLSRMVSVYMKWVFLLLQWDVMVLGREIDLCSFVKRCSCLFSRQKVSMKFIVEQMIIQREFMFMWQMRFGLLMKLKLDRVFEKIVRLVMMMLRLCFVMKKLCVDLVCWSVYRLMVMYIIRQRVMQLRMIVLWYFFMVIYFLFWLRFVQQ